MGRTTKSGRTKFLKFSGREQSGVGDTIFDFSLVGGKTLEEAMSGKYFYVI